LKRRRVAASQAKFSDGKVFPFLPIRRNWEDFAAVRNFSLSSNLFLISPE
jgi:hypothetical protein